MTERLGRWLEGGIRRKVAFAFDNQGFKGVLCEGGENVVVAEVHGAASFEDATHVLLACVGEPHGDEAHE